MLFEPRKEKEPRNQESESRVPQRGFRKNLPALITAIAPRVNNGSRPLAVDCLHCGKKLKCVRSCITECAGTIKQTWPARAPAIGLFSGRLLNGRSTKMDEFYIASHQSAQGGEGNDRH